MNILKKRWLILLFLPLALLIGSGMVLVSAASTKKEPTTLHVRRVNLLPPNHFLLFSPRTITDQQSVQRLYHAIQALPTPSPGVRSCPNDTGLEYQLDFFQGSSFMQEITFDIGGCPFMHFGKQGTRMYDRGFIDLFAQVAGISEKELAPSPLFSCTSHSPCPSPTP